MFGRAYFGTPHRLAVDEDNLELVYPLSRRTYPRTHVRVEMGSTYDPRQRGYRQPTVLLHVHGRNRPVALREFRAGAVRLYQALSPLLGPRAESI